VASRWSDQAWWPVGGCACGLPAAGAGLAPRSWPVVFACCRGSGDAGLPLVSCCGLLAAGGRGAPWCELRGKAAVGRRLRFCGALVKLLLLFGAPSVGFAVFFVASRPAFGRGTWLARARGKVKLTRHEGCALFRLVDLHDWEAKLPEFRCGERKMWQMLRYRDRKASNTGRGGMGGRGNAADLTPLVAGPLGRWSLGAGTHRFDSSVVFAHEIEFFAAWWVDLCAQQTGGPGALVSGCSRPVTNQALYAMRRQRRSGSVRDWRRWPPPGG